MEKGASRDNIITAYRVSYLVGLYLNGRLTPEESKEFEAWKNESEEHRAIFDELTGVEGLKHGLAQRQLSEELVAPYLAAAKEKIQLAKKKRRTRIVQLIVTSAAAATPICLQNTASP